MVASIFQQLKNINQTIKVGELYGAVFFRQFSFFLALFVTLIRVKMSSLIRQAKKNGRFYVRGG